MTPSINRLHDSAETLGNYILDAEYEVVREDFEGANILSLDQFCEWVTGYMYYNALVCCCHGQQDGILEQLHADYAELTEDHVVAG